MWSRRAESFGIELAAFTGEVWPLESQVTNDAELLAASERKHSFVEPHLQHPVSPWYTSGGP